MDIWTIVPWAITVLSAVAGVIAFLYNKVNSYNTMNLDVQRLKKLVEDSDGRSKILSLKELNTIVREALDSEKLSGAHTTIESLRSSVDNIVNKREKSIGQVLAEDVNARLNKVVEITSEKQSSLEKTLGDINLYIRTELAVLKSGMADVQDTVDGSEESISTALTEIATHKILLENLKEFKQDVESRLRALEAKVSSIEQIHLSNGCAVGKINK